MAFKTKSGYRITFTVDEEYYNIIQEFSEKMGLSDNQVSKSLMIQYLKQLTDQSVIDDKNIPAVSNSIVRDPIKKVSNNVSRNKKKKR